MDSLPQLIARLRAEAGGEAKRSLARSIARRIEIKLRRASAIFPDLAAWTNAVPRDPAALLGILDLDEIGPALKTEAAMRYDYAQHYGSLATQILFETSVAGPIPCFRHKDSLVFEADGHVVARSVVRSISKPGGWTKHLSTSRTADASKFFHGIDVPALEAKVFRLGHGHLGGHRSLFMYASFDEEIGTAFYRGRRTPSRIVKVHHDRTKRSTRQVRLADDSVANRSQGYYLKAHGYPIAEQELHEDFPIGEALVLANQLSVQ